MRLRHESGIARRTWGTVENLAPSSCDVAAGPCINTLSEEVRPGEVFITLGGPQGHDDRMASCGGLATGWQPACWPLYAAGQAD